MSQMTARDLRGAVDSPLRLDEAARLAVLDACQILDTEPDRELDLLVAHAARVTATPIALISLVAETRQWFLARVGIAASETDRKISFCTHAIANRAPLTVRDARLDPRFANNPLVLGDPRVVFYAGWPLITHDGYALGTLCIIDHVPRELSKDQCDAMSLLARQVVLSLELRRAAARGGPAASPLAQLLEQQSAVENERRAQAQLAQLVVHDLKTPLTVIYGNLLYVLEDAKLDPDHTGALRDALAGVDRMQGMLIDLLDISRADNSDGKLLARRQPMDAATLVREIVGHGHAGHAKVVPKLEGSALPIVADSRLLSRVLTNLIDNAQRFAPAQTQIEVAARAVDGAVELSVADTGRGIPDRDKARVFEKYIQLDTASERTGRGLGLVFCQLAAEAHGGRIWVEDNKPCGARFRILIPDL